MYMCARTRNVLLSRCTSNCTNINLNVHSSVRVYVKNLCVCRVKSVPCAREGLVYRGVPRWSRDVVRRYLAAVKTIDKNLMHKEDVMPTSNGRQPY